MAKEKKPRKPRGKFKAGSISIGPPGPPCAKGIRFGSMGEIRAPSWDWRSVFLSYSLNLIEGRKGVGKSSLLATVAAHFTGGPPLPGEEVQVPGAVLWHGPEEDWESAILPRLALAGADVSWCGQLDLTTASGRVRHLTFPSGADELVEICRNGRVRMLVLDPLGSSADPGIDLRQDQDVHLYLESLADACRRAKVTAYLSRHLRKAIGGDPREAGLGGVGIVNTCRTAWRLDEHPTVTGLYVMTAVAGNHADRNSAWLYCLARTGSGVRIEWRGQSKLSAEAMAEGRGGAADRDECRDADALIRAALADGPRPSSDLLDELKAAGIEKYALKQAKAALGVKSRRVHDGPAGKPCWYWDPPKDGFPADTDPSQEEGGGTRADPAP